MRVLLLGEFSGVHTELSKSLKNKGIDVFTISDGDGFKNYPADILIKYPQSKNRIMRLLRGLIYRVNAKLGISGLLRFIRLWPNLKSHMQEYDVVQINNPRFIPSFGNLILTFIVRYLKKHNKHFYMAVLGDDYYTEPYISSDSKTQSIRAYQKKLRKKNIRNFPRNPWFAKKLTDTIINVSDSLIPGLYIYFLPYAWTGKLANVIPFPIDEKRIGKPFTIMENEKIRIFHGWQKGRIEKGNDTYDRVIKRVVEKYGSNRVAYQVVQNVPFEQYMRMFSSCHIFIDQLYAHDKGMNGMFGMAAGKVVFAGFIKEHLTCYPHYHGERIGISASADEEELFDQFCELIEHPLQMNEISRNAIEFVRNNHSSSLVAQMYIDEWTKHF